MCTMRWPLPRLVTPMAIAFCLTSAAVAADYGAKVRFSQNKTLTFPGFDLTYIGERRVTPEKYPRGFAVYDFRVTAGGKSQSVTWSAGTGCIGPAVFQIGQDRFAVELRFSDKRGKLADDELVVSPVTP